MKAKKSNIHSLLNLKAELIKSLKSQKVREAWRLQFIKSTGLYETYKVNR